MFSYFISFALLVFDLISFYHENLLLFNVYLILTG